MDPIECLGTQLEHDGHNYELWLLRNEWHLYRGQPNGTDFYFFVIIRGEPKPGRLRMKFITGFRKLSRMLTRAPSLPNAAMPE